MRRWRVATAKRRSAGVFLQMAAGILLALLCPNVAADAASISSFSPTSGPSGTVLTIIGSGFTTATNLVFNNSQPTLGDFTNISDTQIIAVVPIGAVSGPLTIGTTSSGTATSSASFQAAPVITSFSPQTGPTSTQVYIDGANFIVGGTTVTFSGAAPVSGTVTATTVVEAAVPAGAVTGPITVNTSAGSAVSTNIFTAGNAPTITGFSPTAAGYGTNVTINGGNFFGTPTVEFGGKASGSVSVTSTTQLSATVPAGATTGTIFVSTAYGSFTTSSNFLTGTGPIITDFSPTVGAVNTYVTMDGLNLSTVTNVTFNGVKETITATTPLQVDITTATSTGPIKVFSPQGTFTTSSNFITSAGPIVTDFAPTLGGPGVNVVIDGLNFTGVTSVKFGSTSATKNVTSPTQITATVPSGAATGPITVASNSASFTTSSNFIVTTLAPVITGFTPPNGVRGTVVTINGANYTNLSSVKFNGVTGTYAPPTSTTVLYATVPGGATSGLISVNNSSGTGSSSALFYIQPWITSATASGIVNSSLTINGRNLTNASTVQVSGVNYVFTSSPTQIVAIVPSNAMSGPIIVTTPGGIFINTNSFVVLPKIYSFAPTIGPGPSSPSAAPACSM